MWQQNMGAEVEDAPSLVVLGHSDRGLLHGSVHWFPGHALSPQMTMLMTWAVAPAHSCPAPWACVRSHTSAVRRGRWTKVVVLEEDELLGLHHVC